MQTFGQGGAARTAPASLWPADGSLIDRIDKRLSTPLLRLQLGLPLEVCLSFPGCVFGMASVLAILPSAIGAACTGGGPLHNAHTYTALAIGAALLLLWSLVLAGSEKLAMVLFSMRACVVAPAVGMWLVEANPAFDAAARARAHLLLVAWFAALMPVLVLKSVTRRRRPVVCTAEHVGEATVAAAARKRLRVITRLLSRDSNAAFPSGDALGALVFGYFLWSCGYRRAAAACAAGSCAGRVYWHAHHALDVSVGAAIGLCTSAALDRALGGGATWKMAALAQFACALTAVLCGTHAKAGHEKAKKY